jgi:predicted DNA-binding transcriptional regulator YafY
MRKKRKYNLEMIVLNTMRKLLKEHPGLSRADYADMLGIDQRTFYRYIERFNLEVPVKKDKKKPIEVIKFAKRRPNKSSEPTEIVNLDESNFLSTNV